MTRDSIKKEVITEMYKRKLFGSNHKEIITITRSGFPSDKRGEVKEAIHELIKEGLIVYYDRARNAIQLNKERIDEIEKICSN